MGLTTRFWPTAEHMFSREYPFRCKVKGFLGAQEQQRHSRMEPVADGLAFHRRVDPYFSRINLVYSL